MDSKKLLENYLGFLKTDSSNVSKSSYGNYRSTANRFAKKYDLSKISTKNLEEFLSEHLTNKPSNFNSTYDYIAKLIDYLKNQGIVDFSMDDIKLKKFSKSKVSSEAEQATHLSMSDLLRVKQLLSNNKLSLFQFTFEMVYLYRLSLKELQQCNIKNWNDLDGSFTFYDKNGKVRTLHVNEKLARLIRENDKILREVLHSAFQKRFIHMSDALIKDGFHKTISWEDVVATHDKYFFRCMICQNTYENIPENWVIGIVIGYDRNILVCLNCAKNYGEHHG